MKSAALLKLLFLSEKTSLPPKPECRSMLNGMFEIKGKAASNKSCSGVLNGCSDKSIQLNWDCTTSNKTVTGI